MPKLTKTAAICLALALATTGCSNLGTRDQRTLSGGAIGAGAGAAIGLLGGAPLLGALVGAGAGAAAGAFTSEDQLSLGRKAQAGSGRAAHPAPLKLQPAPTPPPVKSQSDGTGATSPSTAQ